MKMAITISSEKRICNIKTDMSLKFPLVFSPLNKKFTIHTRAAAITAPENNNSSHFIFLLEMGTEVPMISGNSSSGRAFLTFAMPR